MKAEAVKETLCMKFGPVETHKVYMLNGVSEIF